MSTHTPGPWTITKAQNARYIEGDPKRGHVAFVYAKGDRCDIMRDEYSAPEEMEANARLIAAAPDLLDALKVMLKGDELGEVACQEQGFLRLIERTEQARAAIAKAEGK